VRLSTKEEHEREEHANETKLKEERIKIKRLCYRLIQKQQESKDWSEEEIETHADTLAVEEGVWHERCMIAQFMREAI